MVKQGLSGNKWLKTINLDSANKGKPLPKIKFKKRQLRHQKSKKHSPSGNAKQKC